MTVSGFGHPSAGLIAETVVIASRLRDLAHPPIAVFLVEVFETNETSQRKAAQRPTGANARFFVRVQRSLAFVFFSHFLSSGMRAKIPPRALRVLATGRAMEPELRLND